MLETPTTNEIKLHLWRWKYSRELGGDKETGNNVVVQNHWRSRHERQINFPELCMGDSLQSGTQASIFAIPPVSLFACANISIRAIIFVQAARLLFIN